MILAALFVSGVIDSPWFFMSLSPSIGAVVMAIGGIVELLFGVNAEKKSLEDIALPLTVEEAEEGGPPAAVATTIAIAPSPRTAGPRPSARHRGRS